MIEEAQQVSFLEAAGGGYQFSDDEVLSMFYAFDNACDLLEDPQPPTQAQVRKAYLESEMNPPLQPLPLGEMGGKVRVATLHPAEEVQCARIITKKWLASLRQCVTTKDVLLGREVNIERESKDAILYSADLSAATDFIDPDLAQQVGLLLCERINPDDKPVVEKIFSPKTVPDGSLTKSGVFMGLGPSWVILNILNGYAAWLAGAPKHSYRICGDDLTGYWSRRTCDRYEKNLTRLGLVVNKSKSFRGHHGVFCERLMVPNGATATSHDVGHLSGMTAAKYFAHQSDQPLLVADNLESSPILDVRQEVRRRLLPCDAGPGLVRNGGKGSGDLHIGGLLNLVKGRVGLVKVPKLPVRLEDDLDLKESGQVLIDDLQIAYRTAIYQQTLMEGRRPDDPKPISSKQFKQLTRLNRPGGDKLKEQLRRAVQSSSLSRSDKRTANWLLKRPIKSTARCSVRHRLERVLSRGRAKRYVSAMEAKAFIEKHTNLTSRYELLIGHKIANLKDRPAAPSGNTNVPPRSPAT